MIKVQEFKVWDIWKNNKLHSYYPINPDNYLSRREDKIVKKYSISKMFETYRILQIFDNL